jgi:hypothetical protein
MNGIHRDAVLMRGAFVGCLTARHRYDPKQAGFSNQCSFTPSGGH